VNDILKRLKLLENWEPKEDWLKITTIDAHSAGEPLRIIISGFPEIKGKTILEYRQFVKDNFDHLRTGLMWEPRGHADMYGCIITPPVTSTADFGILFLHNEGYSTMCGHAILTITKVVIETEILEMKSPITEVKIDTPAGLVTAFAKIENGRVGNVYFNNVPSFVVAIDQTIKVPDVGVINYDLAFGGAFYVFVQADEVGVTLTPEHSTTLIKKGMAIKRTIMKNRTIKHPFESDLNFLYGTIFIGDPLSKDADSRNVCIFADGEVDRCPTGTGVSARMAIHYKKGEIGINESMIIESIIGSKYIGSVVETTTFGGIEAVIPRVEGTAHITGINKFIFDPNEPLKNGFILR